MKLNIGSLDVVQLFDKVASGRTPKADLIVDVNLRSLGLLVLKAEPVATWENSISPHREAGCQVTHDGDPLERPSGLQPPRTNGW